MKHQISSLSTYALRSLFAGSLLFAITPASSAEVEELFRFEFNSAAPNSTAAYVNVSDMSWVIEGTTGLVGFGGSTSTAYASSDRTPDSFNVNNYMTFTIEAAEGELLYMQSFTYVFGGTIGTAQTPPSEITFNSTVKASTTLGEVDSSAALVLLPSLNTVASEQVTRIPGQTEETFSTFTFDLSEQRFQGVESIAFKIYVSDDNNTRGSIMRFYSAYAEGSNTPVIPEPGTVGAVFATAGLFTALILRRRKN